MGDKKEQQQDTTSAARPPVELHHEPPHDKEAARATSLAGLQRESEKVKASLHSASNSQSMDAVKAALKNLAMEIHGCGEQFRDLTDLGKTKKEDSTKVVAQIDTQYAALLEELKHVGRVIEAVSAPQKPGLKPDIGSVQGALFMLQAPHTVATDWVKTQKAGEGLKLDFAALQQEVDRYPGQVGASTASIERNTHVPAGTAQGLANDMTEKQFMALDTALDSVGAGNDSEVGRVVIHVEYVAGMEKQTIAAHRKRIENMVKVLDAIHERKPTLDHALLPARATLKRLIP